MKRYGTNADVLTEYLDGEWIRYSDHIDAMRIAGEGREPVAWLQTEKNGAKPLVFLHKTGWAPAVVQGSQYEWHPLGFIGASHAALTDDRISAIYYKTVQAQRTPDAGPFHIAFARAILAAPPEPSRQGVASGDTQKPVATIRVTNNGYSMTLSTYVAYALPEGKHDLYAAPPESRQMVASGERQAETMLFEACVFLGDPPAPFSNWQEWAVAPGAKKGVTVRASTADDWRWDNAAPALADQDTRDAARYRFIREPDNRDEVDLSWDVDDAEGFDRAVLAAMTPPPSGT